MPLLVLGGGSNLVVSDAGFDGLVVVMSLKGKRYTQDGAITVAAGELWDDVVRDCVGLGLSGIECLSGIPGSAGATPIQNVGAYGQEVGDVLEYVDCLDRQSQQPVRFSRAECAFSYRGSRFKYADSGRYVVTAMRMRLSTAPPSMPRYPELQCQLEKEELELSKLRKTVLETRRRKSMVLDPDDVNARSCGSFFVNPVLGAAEFENFASRAAPLQPPGFRLPTGDYKLPAAWLIENAGFKKGLREGNVGLSTKHTLCLVAHPGATSAAVLEFAQTLAYGVFNRFGVRLKPEPVFIGLDWPSIGRRGP